MSLETERSAIEGRWQTLWVAGSPSAARTTTGYGRYGFEPARGSNSVRLTILSGAADTISAGDPGNNVTRSAGVIMIEIFVPGDSGEATVRPLADAAMDIYRNEYFGGIRCRTPYIMAIREEPPFLVWVVAVPFERDETNG